MMERTEAGGPFGLRLSEGLGHNAQDVERWYCLSRYGMATLCVDEDDANEVAAKSWVAYPQNGPYRAARMVDAAEIDRLRAALMRLLDGSQHCGEMQWCGEEAESPWEAARVALGPNA